MKSDKKIPDILYEDHDITVIRKPAYFSVQSAMQTKPDCVSFLKNHIHEKEGKKDPYIALIHRLDEPVEGIVVFANNKRSAAFLSDELKKGRFDKRYTAAVKSAGFIFPEENGQKLLVDHIVTEKKGNLSKIVPEGTPGAKRAELIYSVTGKVRLGDTEEVCILDIRLLTGRHHQIRLQLKNAGFPVIGDRKYGIADENDLPLCLCADRLAFDHPKTGNKMEFKIEPAFMQKLRA